MGSKGVLTSLAVFGTGSPYRGGPEIARTPVQDRPPSKKITPADSLLVALEVQQYSA